ncbi:bifunctional 2-polyprenyl-6-hydroxyphenol methylase/3-demethylubiquinol 3-O-methyltransferase UbiG [Nocardioides sp. zg-1228]|uniref:class I SAM-dependent methyltransferase n=1 Tax=Nocardioides sp. zg-1228 TaxID=2763008 RepID=UPI001642D3F7|nr:methyltransferase domain-containing protein [Nocardioides sp. zg-1228]MBC2934531.1 class I SAM-dependent methyltransferase [Nocardioides sp. zg-1228]QSF59287.1 class I SAM-dependent methyltransferase [Nocardioides sp. zg-1228]
MGIGYATAYRAGITPWEKASREDQPTLLHLLDHEETLRPDRLRRAIDLGCGRGANTKLLVDRGWDAMGIDFVRQAVDVAVRRNGLDDARFVIGDVRHLVHSGVGNRFDLFLDVGCFQSLDDAGRTLMAGGVTELAEPDATILMRTGGPRAWPIRARNAVRHDIERAYRGWDVTAVSGIGSTDAAAPARAPGGRRGEWFRLTRA